MQLAAGFGFLAGVFRKPVNAAEEKHYGDNQPRIAWRDAHQSQDHDVTRRHKQRRNQDDEKRFVHGIPRGPAHATVDSEPWPCPSPRPPRPSTSRPAVGPSTARRDFRKNISPGSPPTDSRS